MIDDQPSVQGLVISSLRISRGLFDLCTFSNTIYATMSWATVLQCYTLVFFCNARAYRWVRMVIQWRTNSESKDQKGHGATFQNSVTLSSIPLLTQGGGFREMERTACLHGRGSSYQLALPLGSGMICCFLEGLAVRQALQHSSRGRPWSMAVDDDGVE